MSQNNEVKDDAEIEELRNELGKKISLQTLHDSQGGKLLIDALVMDIISAMEKMANNATVLTLQEFIALSCKIKERIDIVRILTGAKAARELYKQLLDEVFKREPKNDIEEG